jgi:hypothetical protein
MNLHMLDSQVDGTVEQNDIVPALLGLSRMLDDLCQRLDTSAFRRGFPASPEDRTVMLAMLGALSLHRTLHDWLGHCASSTQSLESPQGPTIERLLR